MKNRILNIALEILCYREGKGVSNKLAVPGRSQALFLLPIGRKGAVMDRILKDEIQKEVRDFECYATHPDPETCLEHHRFICHQYELFKKRLKNPVNKRTGAPLKDSTIKGYQHEFKYWRSSVITSKQVIKMLIEAGFIGNKNVDLYSKTAQEMLPAYMKTMKEYSALKYLIVSLFYKEEENTKYFTEELLHEFQAKKIEEEKSRKESRHLKLVKG